ncbi:hypothetical protein N7495_008199 [Penicillium taxi]|uniref:uncharacterized protein n=1 Tax=Penicillium taxi TaxID=168475 RepID=UPI0025459FA2|nr:uncharacterized protein N7495_008199 [Penicillium taxi]KAJ5888158.1 hypothetical protein N7495_008199 [Penicillium taxi]
MGPPPLPPRVPPRLPPRNGNEQVENSLDGATDSHILAQEEPEKESQLYEASRRPEIADLGWARPAEYFGTPLIAGLSNEDWWMLVRRFDKQIYNVKAVPDAPLQRLDLTRAENDDFSPDKLRASVERFYTTVIINFISFIKHIARLRSWKETKRTTIFCVIYFVSWFFDLLITTICSGLIVFIMFPSIRRMLFPAAPLALVNKNTGGVQKPKAGVLGSDTSVTGAPENLKGEAAEQEASNLVAEVANVAAVSAVGKQDRGFEDSEISDTDPTSFVNSFADAKSAASGEIPIDSFDKTRQPMKQTVIDGADKVMQVLCDITDTFEKFGNAVSPTPPFDQFAPRMRFASILAPICAVSMLISSYLLIKILALVIGLAFFGEPVVKHGTAYLDEKYPTWKDRIQLGNSLLKGIPTNAQLTLTILRIGEANSSPLPPPPIKRKPSSRPESIRQNSIPLGASQEEINQAAAGDNTLQSDSAQGATKKNNWATKSLFLLRQTTATGIEGKRVIDRMRAVAGSLRAQNQVGVLRLKDEMSNPIGPTEFEGRYRGKRGAVVIDSTKEPQMLYFTTDMWGGGVQMESRKASSVLFTMPVTDIRELKKEGGMGWKGKLVVGWAMGAREVVDGLLIVGKDPEQAFQLTAMKTRNQLFNRLIAIDTQIWEYC